MTTSQKHRPSLPRALGFRIGAGSREAIEREAAAELGFDTANVTAWQVAFAEAGAARDQATPQEAFTEGEAAHGEVTPQEASTEGESAHAEASPVEPPAPRPARRLALFAPSPRRSREELEQEAARELELVASQPEQD